MKRYILYVGTDDEDRPVKYVGNVEWDDMIITWEWDEHHAGLFSDLEADEIEAFYPDILAEVV